MESEGAFDFGLGEAVSAFGRGLGAEIRHGGAVRNAECGMRSAECRMRNLDLR